MDEKTVIHMSVSRTTKFEYIHLDNSFLNKKFVVREQPKLELLNSHFSSDFIHGKIYEVTFM